MEWGVKHEGQVRARRMHIFVLCCGVGGGGMVGWAGGVGRM